MGKKKVVLDTNILISALGWPGKPREIFRRILNNEFELVVSHQQLDELRRVMGYPKFKFTEDQKARFITILLEVATVVKTFGDIKIIEEDPDDNVILETATVGNAEFIISGDEHLLKLKEYARVKIVTAAQFLRLVG